MTAASRPRRGYPASPARRSDRRGRRGRAARARGSAARIVGLAAAHRRLHGVAQGRGRSIALLAGHGPVGTDDDVRFLLPASRRRWDRPSASAPNRERSGPGGVGGRSRGATSLPASPSRAMRTAAATAAGSDHPDPWRQRPPEPRPRADRRGGGRPGGTRGGARSGARRRRRTGAGRPAAGAAARVRGPPRSAARRPRAATSSVGVSRGMARIVEVGAGRRGRAGDRRPRRPGSPGRGLTARAAAIVVAGIAVAARTRSRSGSGETGRSRP